MSRVSSVRRSVHFEACLELDSLSSACELSATAASWLGGTTPRSAPRCREVLQSETLRQVTDVSDGYRAWHSTRPEALGGEDRPAGSDRPLIYAGSEVPAGMVAEWRGGRLYDTEGRDV